MASNGLKVGSVIIPGTVLVLEYSQSQNAWHVHALADMVKTNMHGFCAGDPGDYVIVGIYDDYEKLCEFRDRLIRCRQGLPALSKVTADDFL